MILIRLPYFICTVFAGVSVHLQCSDILFLLEVNHHPQIYTASLGFLCLAVYLNKLKLMFHSGPTFMVCLKQRPVQKFNNSFTLQLCKSTRKCVKCCLYVLHKKKTKILYF